MVMPSGDKAYATLLRSPQETVWEMSEERVGEERAKIEEAMAEAAKVAGLTLFSAKPEAGWETDRHSRDGKYWPCAERTQGARPVWIWAARR
jgi:hypothetical protein